MGRVIYRGGAVIVDPGEIAGRDVITNGAVLVDGRNVAAAGPFDQIRAANPDVPVVGSEEHVVMPGLINTHHHGVGMSWTRLGVPDSYLEKWLIGAFQMKPLDPYLDTVYGDMQNLRAGVTTTVHSAYDRHWLPYATETAEKVRAHADSGIRTWYGVHLRNERRYVYADDAALTACLPPALAARFVEMLETFPPLTWTEYRRVYDLLRTQYAGHPRLEFALSPLGPQWVSADSLRRIRRLATDTGAIIHLHCLETWRQREFGRRDLGMTLVEYLDRLEFLGPDVSLAHGVWLTQRDASTLGGCGCSVCHNPGSNLRTGAGISPARGLLAAGVNLSLGMDNFSLGDDEDMFAEVRLASALHRFPAAEGTTPLTHRDAFRMATVGGARTVNAQDRLGKLLPGYQADLVLLNRSRMLAGYIDPEIEVIDVVVQWGSPQDVDVVVVDGAEVIRDGRFTQLDEAEILARLVDLLQQPLPADVERWCATMREVEPHIDRFYESWTPPTGSVWQS